MVNKHRFSLDFITLYVYDDSMNDSDIHSLIERLREAAREWDDPIVTEMTKRSRDPYKVLISTLISLRTKDEVTREASKRLYALADTPERMITLQPDAIEKAIYPAGFYRNKAKSILSVSQDILDRFGGRVPDTLDELLSMDGVGRKTANLVITMGYGKLGICVDTHVHRISNRLGYVSTKTPDETEFALRDKLPKEYWIEYNDLLVTFGQNHCTPQSPHCSTCTIHEFCGRNGVKRSR